MGRRCESVGVRGTREGKRACCRLLSWLFFALFSLLPGLVSADVPREWLGFKVVAVRVVGPQAGRIDERSLGVPIGAPLTRALLRDALRRLGNEGRWADVQIDAAPDRDGIALLFHLSPRLVAMRVEVVGNDVLEDREIGRTLGVRDEAEIEQDLFPTYQEKLRASYAERGYHEARIDIRTRDTDDPARKVLRIEVDEGEPTRIASIAFAGDALPRRKGLRRVLGFAVGDVADQTSIREGLSRTEELLRSVGYYAAELAEPRIERTGPRAVRVVVPSYVGPHYEVRFRGNGPLSESELFAAMALGEERFASEANLRALEQKLTDLYQRYGFRDARVLLASRSELRIFESKVSGERYEEPTVVLEVSIETGSQTEIERIAFPSAVHFDTEFLREQVYSYLEEDLQGSSVQRPVDSDLVDRLGFGGGAAQARRSVAKPILLDPRKLFYQRTYDQAMEHLRELYRGDGYLDVQVGPVSLLPLPEPNHAVAVIPIQEGPRTFMYELRVQGNRHISSRELLAAAALERNAPFSYVKLEEARLRMLETYQEQGFFFARVEPSVQTSGDGTRAAVVFHVEEGYVVRVGAIEVRGHERSRASMILNRVRFRPGDIYRPSVARATQDALLSLDVFTSITVAPDQPDLPSRVKTVVVSVTERKSQWLGWSAGFSTGEGVRGGFEYGYRNLFGSAVHASFRGQLGYQFVFLDREIEQRYESLSLDQRLEYQTTLTFGVPYVPHLPRVNFGLDFVVLQDIQRDFRMMKQSVVGSVIYRPHRRWTLTLAEELEASDFALFAQDLDRIGNLTTSDLVPEGDNTLASSQFTVAWDMRDRAYNPRRGFLISVMNEYARTLKESLQSVGMGEDQVVFRSNMLRVVASVAFYVPLAQKLVFASQWRYGRVVHLDATSQSYPNRRFYLGGTNFRGFNQNQMIPQDLEEDPNFDASSIVSRGGETFIAAQNELRFPLVGGLYGGLFTDVGNLWADPQALDVLALETVVGAGLRFQTPVASLAFDYGVRALQTRPFNLVGAFQFAFQTF